MSDAGPVDPHRGPARPYPRESTVYEVFAEQVARRPQATALLSAAGRMDYAELDRRARSVADALHGAGAAGQPVGLYVERSPAAIVGMVAILRVGGTYVPLDPADPHQRIETMVRAAGAGPVLTTAALAARLRYDAARVVLIDGDDEGAPTGHRASGAALNPAYVLYTSGSTGVPKAVRVPHRAIVRLVLNTDYVTIGSADVLLHAAPLTFDASTFEIWGALLNGAAMAILPPTTPSVASIARALAAERVTTAWLPSALFREVARHDPGALRGLHTLITGGDVVSADSVRAALTTNPQLTIVNGYGPTEATTFSCAHVMTARNRPGATVPIGRPIANTTAYVLDENLAIVAPGVVGELCIGGDGLALDYLNDPLATERAFVPDPHSTHPEARLFRTGDRAELRDDGTLEFRGRVDRQVKVRGFRVELGEIETILDRHPAVQDAIVVQRAGPMDERHVVAYVTPTPEFRRDFVEGAALDERVSQWRDVYEGVIYDGMNRGADPADVRFNTQGWTSSYDGRPIPEWEMREQVDQTVARILETGPRRMLEIGCGTGLLLFRIRPHCERYVGTDFSPAALDYVRRHLNSAPAECRTSLYRAEARDLAAVAGERFDTVVLNSIVQHFPTADYLRDLLTEVAGLVADGGTIFLGDLRSRTLLPLFHLSVLLRQHAGTASLSQLARLVSTRVAAERELAIDPGFFTAAALPRLRGLAVDVKRGHGDTEMTSFRFDVRLLFGAPAVPVQPHVTVRWGEDVHCLDEIADLLHRHTGDTVTVRSIANRRYEAERRIWARIQHPAADVSLADAIAAVDPEQLWALAARHELDVHIGLSADPDLGRIDATFGSRSASSRPGWIEAPRSPPAAKASWRDHANDPMAAAVRTRLTDVLRNHFSDTAPGHLMPAFFVVLDDLPLTDSGKIDVSALPQPERLTRDAHTEGTRSPGDPTVARLTAIWEQLLGVWPVEEHESLFELGGNSLTVIQLVSRIEDEFDLQISPVSVFERPTVAGLAELLGSDRGHQAWQSSATRAAERGRQRRERAATRRPGTA